MDNAVLTVEDYLAKVNIEEIIYINKIPLNKVIIDIPHYNPKSLKYSRFWKDQIKRCIDGYWVEENDEYKYVPGPLHFYVNHWHILLNKELNSKTKTIGRPFLRDLEWIKSFVFLILRGFSGFEDDHEYTCHEEVAKPAEERFDIFMDESCYKKNGELKTYIDPYEYLKKYFNRPMGKPLYKNMARNIMDIESRGGGKSYQMSAFLGQHFLFDGATDFETFWESRNTVECLSSETLVGAIDSKYSDDTVKKVRLGLETLPGEFTFGGLTYPPPMSKAHSGQWTAGRTVVQEVEKKVGGQWKRVGSRSKFQHRSFNDNEFAANGTRPGFSVLDEIGLMGNLLEALVQLKECTADGAFKFGSIWMTGTGGDMDGGATAAAMAVFYDPANYECYGFKDNYEGSENLIGMFIPAWMGLNQFKDEFGNTKYRQAIKYLLNVRLRLAKGKNKTAYNGELTQRPIFPSEAFLVSGGNIFPISRLRDQLQACEVNREAAIVGVFGKMGTNTKGEVEFQPDLEHKLQECDWPVKKGDNNTGGIRIWEQPQENAQYGVYLAGNDNYDQDIATTSVSLGCTLIFKRTSPGTQGYDQLVAEYTGRPETAKECYEQTRKLLMYYNIVASCLYENEKIGIKAYFENMNSLYMFAPTPGILKANLGSAVNRSLGQHMSTKVKDEVEIMTRDWLIAPAGEGKVNLQHIYSKPLLKELINYNKNGNFDRVIALMLCVVQMSQMHKVIVEKAEEAVKQDPFFERQLFMGTIVGSQEVGYEDIPSVEEEQQEEVIHDELGFADAFSNMAQMSDFIGNM